MTNRRPTQPVVVGGVKVGGDAPIAVEAGTKASADQLEVVVGQVRALRERGCDIVRVPVRRYSAAKELTDLRFEVAGALVADVGTSPLLGFLAVLNRFDGVELSLTSEIPDSVLESLARLMAKRHATLSVRVEAAPDEPWDQLVARAETDVRRLERAGFPTMLVSVQGYDTISTIEANRALAARIAHPIQIKLTQETAAVGTIRSAVAAGNLLADGIGDSLEIAIRTVDPIAHVDAAYEVLKALNLREHGPVLISCPTCGRLEIDLVGLANAVDEQLRKVEKPVTVAVMGCVVNGPGEAREADVGVAGGRGRAAIFRKGKIVKSVDEADLMPALMAEIEAVAKEK